MELITATDEAKDAREKAIEAAHRYIDARRAWVFDGGSAEDVTEADVRLTQALLKASTTR